MGFDCTLHVIDPASLASFADRFLRRSKKKHAFDKKYPDGAALFDEVRGKLEGSPEEAASSLLALCLMWCSCDAPHEPSRNFALSYWPPRTQVDPFPNELLSFNLSTHLRAIEEAYPQLTGKLSLGFDGNWSVGYFVEPHHVSAARAFVERQLPEITADTRRALEPLLKVLRVAEARGLAYWEGTDLAVAMGNPGWLKPAKVVAALEVTTLLHIPEMHHHANVAAVEGDRFVMSRARPDELHVVDLAASPPSVTHLPGSFFLQAQLRGGVVYGVGRHHHANPYGLYELPIGGEPKLLAPRQEELGGMALLDGAILIARGKGKQPWLHAGGEHRELALPSIGDGSGVVAAPFGDGSHLVCLGQQFYVLERDASTRHLEPPPELAGDHVLVGFDFDEQWCDRPGRVLMHTVQGLMRVGKEGHFERFASEIVSIMQVVRGPDHAIVVRQGDNESDDLFKILWPTMEVTSVTARDLGIPQIGPLFYAPAHRSLVIHTGTKFLGVAWDQLAARPRRALGELAAKQEAERARNEARRRKAWQEDTARLAGSRQPIQLPLPADGTVAFVASNDLVVHPAFGLGIVRSRQARVTEPVTVAFEHGDEKVSMISPA